MAAMGLTSPLLLGVATPALGSRQRNAGGTGRHRHPRGEARSVTDSTVPIDVLSSAEFANQGDTDLSNLLRNVVPSYNVNSQPISDAATIVRPANLRGLAPDHTLVLINGKRRHRAAVIYWLGNGVADGAQGPDISAIPSSALKQVEVLRDGASAQYGSDAIAGVMNFILNDANEGANVEARYGGYYAGDGATYAISGNIGLPLTDNGFANFSFEYGESGSDRPQRPARRRSGADRRRQHRRQGSGADLGLAGDPGRSQDVRQLGRRPEREPRALRPRQLRLQDGDRRLLLPQSQYARGRVQRRRRRDAADRRSDAGHDARARPSRSRTTFPIRQPGGGARRSELLLVPGDVSRRLHAAVRRRPEGLRGGRRLARHGRRAPQLGCERRLRLQPRGLLHHQHGERIARDPTTPTTFDPGSYIQDELNVNFDVAYELSDAVTLAGGAEYRDETFEIDAGQIESWDFGPLAAQGFSAASNGFPGFSDQIAGSWSRTNYALYGDVGWRVTDPWQVDLAVRWEDFEDFGTTTNGKVATNYRFNEAFAVRGSWSTGFRAPTPGQSNASNVTTQFDPDHRGAGQQRHDSVDQSGGDAARRRGARA